MSLNTHVESLNQKHAEIETSIEKEEVRPYPDAMRLMQLKREKLRLKEQLRRISRHH
ncbi:YdcH family protein [Kordiimonas pumila]|uniref:YdcH family protein n=1 Tax=Kordiimonas pumila TaxID=2161677 RepID=A0ABV7D686_9PROT|nr:YdcH family protein [Kordiimonas pumila]